MHIRCDISHTSIEETCAVDAVTALLFEYTGPSAAANGIITRPLEYIPCYYNGRGAPFSFWWWSLEELFIPLENRFRRKCKWYPLNESMPYVHNETNQNTMMNVLRVA